MARPRIFVSSTFYDLRHIRVNLQLFIEQLGYEAILSEKGRIAYDPDIPLDESCYREAGGADVFVLIIGGRYGSAASAENLNARPKFYERYESITKMEYKAAHSRDIPTYILVERSVYGEYETYLKNRENDKIEYAHVESVNVFRLLDEILALRRNNPVFQFGEHVEIEQWLRDQWAGLFKEFIGRRSEQKQLASLSERVAELADLNSSLQRYLEEIISRVSGTKEEAEKIIKSEHGRQDADRKFREFLNIDVVSQLRELYEVSDEEVEKIYRKATSIEDLAQLCAEAAASQPLDPAIAIAHWRKNPRIVNDINRARDCLGCSALEFQKSKGSSSTAASTKRRGAKNSRSSRKEE